MILTKLFRAQIIRRNPLITKCRRLLNGYKTLREANHISQHFLSFFTPVLASSPEDLLGAHKVRHDVFCEELKLFKAQRPEFEQDDYDAYAKQCVIKHERTRAYAGTVRMIMPETNEQTLPIEKVASQYITKKEYLPSNFKRSEVCEISRIAIHRDFRRRKADQFEGAATGGIDDSSYSDIELRCFPLLAVGLYMTTAAVCLAEGKKHAYFMVEPRLAKSMSFIGIKLVKIGDEFDYVGRRAPYYINNQDFVSHLSPSFMAMMKAFTKIIGGAQHVSNTQASNDPLIPATARAS